MQKEQESVDSFVCPSFSAYSSNKLDDIVDQVTRESHLRAQNDNDENDFEFVAFQKAADGVFVDGDAASHVFPIFNRELLTERDGDGGGRISGTAAIRVPFRKLLIGDEEHGSVPSPASSSSSSEVEDDLEGIPAGTYCLWTPKSVQASPSRCKKSNSTGSSSSSSSPLKRWKFLSLLRRSNSEGKESLVLSLGSNSAKKKGTKEGNSKQQCGTGSAGGNSPRIAGKKVPAAGEKKVLSPAYEELYGKKREIRRSYLPYRQNLVNWVLR